MLQTMSDLTWSSNWDMCWFIVEDIVGGPHRKKYDFFLNANPWIVESHFFFFFFKGGFSMIGFIIRNCLIGDRCRDFPKHKLLWKWHLQLYSFTWLIPKCHFLWHRVGGKYVECIKAHIFRARLRKLKCYHFLLFFKWRRKKYTN